MKKRLSLLMVLMMVVSLIPMSAFALSTESVTVKNVTTLNDAENFTVTFKDIAGTYATENLRIRLVDAEGNDTDAIFNSLTGTPGGAATLNTDKTEAMITLPAGTRAAGATQVFTFVVNFEDASEGDVYLAIENTQINPQNTIFGNGVDTKIAVVKPHDTAKLAATVRDAEKKVSLKGGSLSEFYVSNLTGSKVRLILDDLDWDTTGTKIYNQNGGVITPTVVNSRTLDVALGGGVTGLRVLPSVLEAGRKADFGSVIVDIESYNALGDLLNTNRATIGQLVDYAVTMEVVEKGKKEIPSLWGGEEATVKVTLKGPKGSLLNQRIDFTVSGADVKYGRVTSDSPVTPPSEYNAVKNAGAITGDPKDVKSLPSVKVFKDKEFSIDTTGVDYSQETEVSFEIVVVAAGDKDGTATITALQRGLEVTADLAKITPKFSATADVTPVKKGEARDTATVTITEAKAGLIQKGEKLTLSFDTKRDYVEFTTDDITIEATNGMKFDTTSTGLKLNKGTGNDKGEVQLSILVDKASTGEPAVITVSGLNVSVDGSTTDDVVALDTGLIERTSSVKAKTSYNVSSVDYIKVVKEYDMESILSVFTIGQTTYTVNGVEKAAASAPYIKEGRTMLPIRAVAESLGLTVQWNAATKTASFADASKVAAVTIGAKVLYVNGTPMPLSAPAELVNDTTFVELRSLATAFSVQIDWDAAAKTATVSK